MTLFDPSKYKYYVTGNKVIAVTHYCGKTVKGVAKCSDQDTFDLEKGKLIAGTRAFDKVCARRENHAREVYIQRKKERRAAQEALNQAKAELEEAQRTANYAWNLKQRVLGPTTELDMAIDALYRHVATQCATLDLPMPASIDDVTHTALDRGGDDYNFALSVLWLDSPYYEIEIVYHDTDYGTVTLEALKMDNGVGTSEVTDNMDEVTAWGLVKLFLAHP